MESYNKEYFQETGLNMAFVKDNESKSSKSSVSLLRVI